MKRRITVEQLQELTFQQEEKLRELWSPEFGDFYAFGHHYDINQVPKRVDMLNKKNCLPLLDIGQMIEILQVSENADYWHIYDETYYKIKGIKFYINIDNEDLCDDLWVAVKEILK